MFNLTYVECLECGTVHYIINEVKAKEIDGSAAESHDFSKRNLKCCYNCGSSKRFLDVTEEYLSEYSFSDNIPPILIGKDQIETTASRKSI